MVEYKGILRSCLFGELQFEGVLLAKWCSNCPCTIC